MKYLVLGAVLYFVYKFMFPPALKEGKQASKEEEKYQEGDIEIRRDAGNPRGERGDFIDYEEVE